MQNAEIRRLLSTSIESSLRSNEKERQIFSDKKGGNCYTIKLTSGLRFVAHIPESVEDYTFRPLFKKDLPDLQEIEWCKEKSFYTVHCVFDKDLDKKSQNAFLNLLNPQTNESQRSDAKMAFTYCSYHPLLARAIRLQIAYLDCVLARKELAIAQRKLNALLTPHNYNQINLIKNRRRQNG